MSNNVREGKFVTREVVAPEKVLGNATDLKDVMVIGHKTDGKFYIASSHGYAPDMLFLLELAKSAVLKSVA